MAKQQPFFTHMALLGFVVAVIMLVALWIAQGMVSGWPGDKIGEHAESSLRGLPPKRDLPVLNRGGI